MLYYLNCLRQDYLREPRAPVPEIFLAVAGAADREAAMDQVQPHWRAWLTDHSLKAVLDLDALVERGEDRRVQLGGARIRSQRGGAMIARTPTTSVLRGQCPRRYLGWW
jgi:hypothetical protein